MYTTVSCNKKCFLLQNRKKGMKNTNKIISYIITSTLTIIFAYNFVLLDNVYAQIDNKEIIGKGSSIGKIDNIRGAFIWAFNLLIILGTAIAWVAVAFRAYKIASGGFGAKFWENLSEQGTIFAILIVIAIALPSAGFIITSIADPTRRRWNNNDNTRGIKIKCANKGYDLLIDH